MMSIIDSIETYVSQTTRSCRTQEILSIIVKEWGASLPWDHSRCSGAAQEHAFSRPTIWLPIIHVCQRWRDVAIQLSTLSTHLILNRFDFLDVMLTRSRPFKISLFYYIPSQFNDAKQSRIFDAVPLHLHRVKLLQIVSYAPSFSRPTFTLVLSPRNYFKYITGRSSILRSCDNVDSYVHKEILAAASSIFDTPPPSRRPFLHHRPILPQSLAMNLALKGLVSSLSPRKVRYPLRILPAS
ncbi:hypothetical protein QCA50_019807 [Cerrena zonata]|uniref:F-box domain-containing protein n=1 Tax=Cerrena zonata TaxID=2478898 RepID=A0AAW0F8W0_9APHY